jgi:small subunit ribosomal protein S20
LRPHYRAVNFKDSGSEAGGKPAGQTRIEVPVPRIKSAKKRMRQTKTRTARNKAQRSQLRNAVRKVRSTAAGPEAKEAFGTAEKLLDRAARKRLVHPNTAARAKSRLAKAVKKA